MFATENESFTPLLHDVPGTTLLYWWRNFSSVCPSVLWLVVKDAENKRRIWSDDLGVGGVKVLLPVVRGWILPFGFPNPLIDL